MDKKYNFTTYDIANWHSESLDEFKVRGNVDEISLIGIEKGKKPISAKNEKEGQGWVIFEPIDFLERRQYLEIKDQHELLVLIKLELQKIRKIDIITGNINDLNSCQNKIIENWGKLQVQNQNFFINEEIKSLLKTAPKKTISTYEKLLEKIESEKRTVVLKNWMEGELSKMSTSNKQKKRLTLAQIALISIYENKQISRDNANKLANKHSYKAKTSGEALYQKFNKYHNVTDRKGDEGTKLKNKNKIKLLESVIEFLPLNRQDRVKDEIKILKQILESEYL